VEFGIDLQDIDHLLAREPAEWFKRSRITDGV
jgi:hypothetical protein